MLSAPILLLAAAVCVLIFCIFLLFRENERLEAELRSHFLDPSSPKHLEIYQQIVESAQWGIATRSADGQLLEACNPTFARLHGYLPEEVKGMPVSTIFAPENASEGRTWLRQIHSPDHYRFECIHKRKDGSTFPALVDSSVIRDQAGNILFRVLNVLDITEQKAQGARLASSEATLRQMMEKLPIAVWLTDAEGNIRYSNPAARHIMGKNTVPGSASATLEGWWSDSGSRLQANDWPLAKTLESRTLCMDQIIDVASEQGHTKTLVNSALPLLDSENVLEGAIVIVQDITSIRKKDQALASSKKKLRQLVSHQDRVREDERTRIAREIHDELGQHMTALRMDLGLIRMKYAQDDAGLTDEINRMKEAIDETIGVLRNIASDLRPKALDMGFVPAARWLLSTLQKRSDTIYELEVNDEDIVLSDATATTTFRILQESLTNIVRHARASRVTVLLRKNPSTFYMHIKDDGTGFNLQEASDKHTFGLIGLKERAIMLDGDCTIDSKPGEGTVIRLEFPLSEADSAIT